MPVVAVCGGRATAVCCFERARCTARFNSLPTVLLAAAVATLNLGIPFSVAMDYYAARYYAGEPLAQITSCILTCLIFVSQTLPVTALRLLCSFASHLLLSTVSAVHLACDHLRAVSSLGCSRRQTAHRRLVTPPADTNHTAAAATLVQRC